MRTVHVARPVRTREAGADVLAATVTVRGRPHVVRFRATAGPVHDGVELFLLVAVPIALRERARLTSDAPASPRLLANLPRFAARFHAWDRRLCLTGVAVPAAAPPLRPTRAVAAFFSGGVDSFHTLFVHDDAITDLVFVHGFDLPLAKETLRRQVATRLAAAAAARGKGFVEVETDLRALTDRYARWGENAHGPALAAVGHLLAGRYARIFVPGEFFPRTRHPLSRGSHPDTDPLLSSEAVEIVHDGAGVTRAKKLARVASDETVRRTLRVCWENRGDAYNCGACSKCLRNLALLRALGHEGKVTTFARALDLGRLEALDLAMGEWREGMEAALAMTRARGGDPGLERSLRRLLARR